MAEDVKEHFRTFQGALRAQIAAPYASLSEEELVVRQKQQFRRLVRLEARFRRNLTRSRAGESVYRSFVAFIREDRKNILMARPYFRERQGEFSAKISDILAASDWASLRRFHINYEFVTLALENPACARSPSLRRIVQQIEATRHDLVLMNTPLVISRAKIFYGRTQQSHLSFMDLIQLGVLGLLTAVDKYVVPRGASWPFCDVAIGRMVGNFIEWYSATHLHFYPSDRRKLYRANKARAAAPQEAVDFEDLAAAVNQPTARRQAQKLVTTPQEISGLVAAASTVSSDVRVAGDENVPGLVSRFSAPATDRPDVRCEEAEALHRLRAAMVLLPLWDRKFLRLRGVDVALEG